MKILNIDDNFKEVTANVDFVDNHYWILLSIDEIDRLESFISVDKETIDECKSLSQVSKISFFDGYIFLIFNVLNYIEKIVVSKELNVFVNKNYIITVYKDSIDILNTLIKDIRDFKNCFVLKDNPKVCVLLYYILDRIIVRNHDIISELEIEADKIEIRILKNPSHEQIDSLIHLRRQVYKIRKYLNPLTYIGDSLIINDNLVIDKESIKYFISLNKKMEKLMSSSESLVQDLALVREAFESEISNKTNELMKIFTVIATIFLPLNLISSMYGTNLKGIPLIEHDNGCHYVIFIMITVAVTLVVIFKRKKWI